MKHYYYCDTSPIRHRPYRGIAPFSKNKKCFDYKAPFSYKAPSGFSILPHSNLMHLNVLSRAEQYVGIYHTGAISFKYRETISKRNNKTDYRDIEISQ